MYSRARGPCSPQICWQQQWQRQFSLTRPAMVCCFRAHGCRFSLVDSLFVWRGTLSVSCAYLRTVTGVRRHNGRDSISLVPYIAYTHSDVQVLAELRYWRSSGTPSGTADQSLWCTKKGSVHSECDLRARPQDRKGYSRCSRRCKLVSSKHLVAQLMQHGR